MVKRAGSKKPGLKKKAGSGFKYKAPSADAMKRRSEQTGGRFDSPFMDGFDVFKAKGGENAIRILPPTWDEHEHYGLDVWLHRWIGADNSNYLCLQKMKGKSCPICHAAKEAKDAGEVDEAKKLQPAHVVLCWILDRNEDDNNPILYPMSWTIDRDIAALCHNKKTGKILLVDHPDEGYDITFRRNGEGLKTRYSAFAIERDASPISEDEETQNSVLEFITENPLPSVLKYYDAKYLENVLAGSTEAKDEDLDDDDEDDEDEDDEPKSKKKPAKKPSSKKKKPADDDEDEDEEDEDDDDTDDEDDDDGDDEEEDDEEEEEDDDDTDEDGDDDEDSDDDEDEEDDEDEDDDEDDEPAPKKKAKPASKKPAKKPVKRRR